MERLVTSRRTRRSIDACIGQGFAALRRAACSGATLLLLLSATACHTWEIETITPGQSAQWNQPVRVVLTTGEGYEFDTARVSRDTLYGTPRRGSADSTAAIPIRRVLRVQQRDFSEQCTIGAVVGVTLATGALLLGAFLIALSGWGDGI